MGIRTLEAGAGAKAETEAARARKEAAMNFMVYVFTTIDDSAARESEREDRRRATTKIPLQLYAHD